MAVPTLVAFLVNVDPSAHAQDSSVALMYNRVGAADGATTGIEAFENHLTHLSTHNYEVIPLPQIVAALQVGTAIPEHAVAITFDGGHISIYREAWPRLKALGLAFTVFVATDFIDAGGENYMSWEAAADIAQANQRFMDEIGIMPELFAYPFGEYSSNLQKIIARYGYSAAFGQHSGVIYRGADYLALPRYSLVGSYSNMARFQTVVDTLPLPVADLMPIAPLVTNNPPSLGFTIIGDVGPLDDLACYLAQFGKLNIEQLGLSRIEVRFPDALPDGRSRVNCTLPGPGGRWRWFGLQLLVAP